VRVGHPQLIIRNTKTPTPEMRWGFCFFQLLNSNEISLATLSIFYFIQVPDRFILRRILSIRRGMIMALKGDPQVIGFLNKVLLNELTAINQYFLHSKMFKNWGIIKLAEHEWAESIDEMKHADRLIERILFLEGLPNLQQLGKLRIGENVKEILTSDLAMEMNAHPDLKDAIEHCEKVRDYVSRELFSDILESEEEHIDWLQTQLELIERVGIQNYTQTQLGSDAS
jgi:bacterioferritin